jgi:predicted flavoprotein YhiN
MIEGAGIKSTATWGDLTAKNVKDLASELCSAVFQVTGKSTFKEEFVTAGGIDLKEVDFKTFGSKVLPNLFLAGEVLDIDGITGGFNFQAAWTGGFLAGNAMAGYPLE